MATHNKNLLLIDGSGDYSFSLARCIAMCPEYELHLLCLNTDENLYKLKHIHYHIIDNYDEDIYFISQIRKICNEINIELVFAGSETSVEFLIKHQNTLKKFANLPTLPSIEAFQLANNKARLVDFMDQHHIPYPKALTLSSGATTEQILNLTMPVLYKPSDSCGGRGIVKFTDFKSLETELPNLDTRDGLIQEFIEGNDICMSVLCKHGDIVAYTIQTTLIHGIEQYSPAIAVDFVDNSHVYTAVKDLMKTLKWEGVAHIDLRIDTEKDKVYIIEINPRFWGSLMASLFAGINFAQLYCQLNLDEPIGNTKYQLIQHMRPGVYIKYLLKQLVAVDDIKLSKLNMGIKYRFPTTIRLFAK